MEQRALTRREFLVFTGGGLVAAGALGPQAVLAQSTTIRHRRNVQPARGAEFQLTVTRKFY